MKREIKFRGMSLIVGFCEWRYGFFSTYPKGAHITTPDGECWPVAIESVGQFTGLKDKNGKEIYADDILLDGEHKFRVYAMYGGFGIKAPHWSGIMEDMVMGDDLIMQPLADAQTMSYISQSMEVIGNIYENAELLNK